MTKSETAFCEAALKAREIEIDRLRALNAQLVEALYEAEAGGYDGCFVVCPVCGCYEGLHYSSCKLAEALAAAKKGEGE